MLANVALLAIVGIGLNVLMGLTGQMSFGHVGFYAIGAYTVAILTDEGRLGASGSAWPLARAARRRCWARCWRCRRCAREGPYLAMITIAFGFIVEHAIVEARDLTGGQNGIMGIAGPCLGWLRRGERAVGDALAVVDGRRGARCSSRCCRAAAGARPCARCATARPPRESIGLDPLRGEDRGVRAVGRVRRRGRRAVRAAVGLRHAALASASAQSILFVLVVMIGGAGSVAGPWWARWSSGCCPSCCRAWRTTGLLFFGAAAAGRAVGRARRRGRACGAACSPPRAAFGRRAAASARCRTASRASAAALVPAAEGLSMRVRRRARRQQACAVRAAPPAARSPA